MLDKIASPHELQAELRSIMAFIHACTKPDRQLVADKIRSLANRVSSEDLFADDGFSMQAEGGSVAEATFKKLRDGSWGLLVNSARVDSGDRVLTITKAGKRSYKYVGKVIWSGNGVSICTIDEDGAGGGGGSRQSPTPAPSGKASPRQIEYAMNLLQRMGPSGWHDSDMGQGMAMPNKRDLESWSAKDVSNLIKSLKSEW